MVGRFLSNHRQTETQTRLISTLATASAKGRTTVKPVIAVIAGVLIDLLGTIIIAVLIGLALGFYLLSQGVAESELEAVLTARITHAPWNIFLIALGASISVLAGYVTAKIAKHGVYLYAGIVGCISGGFGYSTGLDEYSVPLNVSLALLTIAATIVGAFLWLRRNPPSMTTMPGQ